MLTLVSSQSWPPSTDMSGQGNSVLFTCEKYPSLRLLGRTSPLLCK